MTSNTMKKMILIKNPQRMVRNIQETTTANMFVKV